MCVCVCMQPETFLALDTLSEYNRFSKNLDIKSSISWRLRYYPQVCEGGLSYTETNFKLLKGFELTQIIHLCPLVPYAVYGTFNK